MQLLINEQLVDISHLRHVTRYMTLDLDGGIQKKNARVEFGFSSHCYSRGPFEGEVIPSAMLVPDGSEYSPRHRIFCPDRYRLSLNLVGLIDRLIDSNGHVLRSIHVNFYSTTIVTIGQDGGEIEAPYYVFMSAKKKQDPNQPPKIAVFVESAYPGNPSIPPPKPASAPIKFSAMLGKVWSGRY